jgi:chromosome segregation ATPase
MGTKRQSGYYALKRQISDLEEQQTKRAERIENLEQRVDTLSRQLSQAHEKYDQAAGAGRKNESSVWAERIEQREEALRSARSNLRAAERDRDDVEDKLLELRKQMLTVLFEMMDPQERKQLMRRHLNGS